MSTKRFWLKSALPMCLVIAVAGGAPAVPSLSKPIVAIDLAKFGWTPPVYESNRAFFEDFSIAKLEAIDGNTELAFVTDDVLVAYHTKQERGKDWRTARRELEAFFIRTSDGSLLARKEWKTTLRKDTLDLADTEARIISLSNGRFLVHANGAIMLYSLHGSDLELVREKKLEPGGSVDFWAAQSTPGGRYVFLRHGLPFHGPASYSWLDADSLETRHQMPSSLWAPTAGDNFMVGGSESGPKMIDWDQRARLICDDANCREAGLIALSSHRVALLRSGGVGVMDLDQGLLWADIIERKHVPQFGSLKAAASGVRFAVWAQAVKDPWFHGVKIASPAMFIYDSNNPKPLYALRLKSLEGQFAFALSPDGTQVAVFDANGFRVYAVQ